MAQMRKITVQVPEELLASAQAYTGDGVSKTVQSALRKLVSIHAQQEFRKLRGKVQFSMSWQELKRDRE